jgi:hypothetical protein
VKEGASIVIVEMVGKKNNKRVFNSERRENSGVDHHH